MPSARVTSKGQVTIPKAVRQALRVATGDRLDFVMEGEGHVVIRPGTTDARELKGFLHRPGRRPVSIEEMDAAIARQGRPAPPRQDRGLRRARAWPGAERRVQRGTRYRRS